MAPLTEKESPDDKKEEEDAPAIKELKAMDEKYCKLEKEYELAVEALRTKYFNERQAPLIEERARLLADLTLPGAEAEKEYGTPACVSFWLQAFQNCELSEMIQEWDAPVLAYLRDIKKSYLDDQFHQKGFKLEFLFVENPFFFNSSLWVEFRTNYDPETYQPWKQPDCEEMKSSDIGWKPSKNVTVEVSTKQTKSRGKKAPQKAKGKEEPRDSFFRFLFRNLKVGDEVPGDISLDGSGPDDLDEDDARGLVLMVLNEQFFRLGQMLAEDIIPYAIRFYTGEAGVDEDSDDDDDDDEEDDDEDDDDEDEDSEDVPPAKGKKKTQKKDASAAKAAPTAETGDKKEECKQQ